LTACTFWVFRSLNKQHQTGLKIPIRFDTPSGNYTQLSLLPEYIKANVTATGWVLIRYLWHISRKTVDIKLEKPLSIYYLTKDDLMPIFVENLPELKVNFLMTDTIKILYDSVVQKTVYLSLQTEKISIAEGYFLASPIQILPDSVVLEGARSVLSEIPDVLRIELPETDLNRPYHDFVPITLPDFPTIKPHTEQVQVIFSVEPVQTSTTDTLKPKN